MLWQDYFRVVVPVPKGVMGKKSTFGSTVEEATKPVDAGPTPLQKAMYIEVMK